jgi:hypothetical protein
MVHPQFVSTNWIFAMDPDDVSLTPHKNSNYHKLETNLIWSYDKRILMEKEQSTTYIQRYVLRTKTRNFWTWKQENVSNCYDQRGMFNHIGLPSNQKWIKVET